MTAIRSVLVPTLVATIAACGGDTASSVDMTTPNPPDLAAPPISS